MMDPSERYDSLFMVFAEWTVHRGQWARRATVLDWRLLKKQAQAESGLDPDAISPVGAKGLTQFMDQTWLGWLESAEGHDLPPRRHVSPFDPEDAIRAQSDVMAWLLGVWAGDARKALSSYNWGVGNVQRAVKERGDGWEASLPEETVRYLTRILA